MDTLVSDLHFLLDQHFSTIEDIFINNVHRVNSKNVKVSVRLGDWKSILYHLQRWRYQSFIRRKACYGACQRGDYELMKLFWPHLHTDNITEIFRHLAKYKHYSIIEMFDFRKYSKDLEFPFYVNYDHLYYLVDGLIAGDDIETIKSMKYVEIDRHFLDCNSDHISMLVETIYKYNRMEILKYFLSINPKFLHIHHNENIIIGKIKSFHNLTSDDIGETPKSRNVFNTLVKYNHFELSKPWIRSDFERIVVYAVGLIKAGKHDLLEQLANNSCNGLLLKLRLSIEFDDLENFKNYYGLNLILFKDMVECAIRCSSLTILRYLFDVNKSDDIVLNSLIKDPRIVDMLVEQSNKGRRVIAIESKGFKYVHALRGYDLIVKHSLKILYVD